VVILVAGAPGGRVTGATLQLVLLPNKAVTPLPTLSDSLGLNAAASVSVTLLAGGAGWQFGNLTLQTGQTLTIQGLTVNTVITVPSKTDAYVASLVSQSAAVTAVSPAFAILNLTLSGA